MVSIHPVQAIQAFRLVFQKGSSIASQSMSWTISLVRNVNQECCKSYSKTWSKSHSKIQSKSLTPNKRSPSKSLKRQLVQYSTSGSETSDEIGPIKKKNKKESLPHDQPLPHIGMNDTKTTSSNTSTTSTSHPSSIYKRTHNGGKINKCYTK